MMAGLKLTAALKTHKNEIRTCIIREKASHHLSETRIIHISLFTWPSEIRSKIDVLDSIYILRALGIDRHGDDAPIPSDVKNRTTTTNQAKSDELWNLEVNLPPPPPDYKNSCSGYQPQLTTITNIVYLYSAQSFTYNAVWTWIYKNQRALHIVTHIL